MPISLSPAVLVTEQDLSTTVPQLASSITAMVGAFTQGPCKERKLITNVRSLEEVFGKPTDSNYIDWFTAYNILQYNQLLYIARAENSTMKNAGIGLASNYEIKDTYVLFSGVTTLATIGDSISTPTNANIGSVIYVDSTNSAMVVNVAAGWTGSTLSVTFDNTASFSAIHGTTATITLFSVDDIRLNDTDEFDATDITFNTGENLRIISKYPGTYGNDIKVSLCPASSFSTATVSGTIKFIDYFDKSSLETNEVAVLVSYPDTVDPTTDVIVERFVVSTNPTAKDYNGNTTYIGEYLTRNSNYIAAYSGNSSTFSVPVTKLVPLSGGSLGTYTVADFDECYDLFSNPEEFDVNLIVDCHNTTLGSASDVATLQKSIIDKMVGSNKRNDVFVILSPYSGDVLKKTASQAQAALETYVNVTLNKPTSYAAFYGNWKQQYDRYNDKYRWLPMSGDIAGIFAGSDAAREVWFAPAGLTRGQVKNCVKLAYNPDKGIRDILHKNNINLVVNFPGEGFVVFSQKTLLKASSAFSRVSTRRLFNYMEKAIATASKYFLFEKNTAFTRRQFLSIVNPFLEDIKSKEGLYDFRVVADESNNTGTVIDNNEMVVDFYVQPTKDVEVIRLNFINTKTGVNFDEIINRQ